MAKKKDTAGAVVLPADSEKGETEWSQRLDRMKEFQRKNSKTWERNERLLFGGQPKAGIAGATSDNHNEPTVAYAWGLIKSLETNIYVQNPECAIKSYADKDAPIADLLSQINQYDLDTMDMKSIGNLMLIDNFVYGYGAMVERLDNGKRAVEEEETGEKYTVLESQDYSFNRLHPKDILFDPQSRLLDLSTSRYIALAWYPTISQLKNDPDFKDNLPDDIDNLPEASESSRQIGKAKRGGGVQGGGDSLGEFNEKDPDYKTVCVWEIWDKIEGQVVYVLDANGREIGETPWPFKLILRSRILFPVTLMAMHPQSNGFYPKPEIDLIAPQLIEINAVEAAMREDVASKWRRIVVPAGIFTDDQIGKLTDVKTPWDVIQYDVAELASLVGGPQNLPSSLDGGKLATIIEQPKIDRDLVARKAMLEEMISHITGWGPGDRGGLARTRSAREAMMVNESKNQRLQKRFDAIGDFYRLAIAKHTMILQQTMKLDRYAKIFDEAKGLEQFFKYTKDDIQGMFHFDVYAGSSAPKTTESNKAAELQLFQAVAPIVQSVGGDMTIPFRRLGRAMDWRNLDEVLGQGKAMLKLLAATMVGMEQGKASPAQVLEAGAKAVVAGLTPAEIQMLKSQMAGNPGAGGGGGGASMAPGQSPAGGDQNPLGTASGTM